MVENGLDCKLTNLEFELVRSFFIEEVYYVGPNLKRKLKLIMDNFISYAIRTIEDSSVYFGLGLGGLDDFLEPKSYRAGTSSIFG